MSPAEIERPIRLLVVDDEPDVQTLFELRFRRDVQAGRYEMTFATSGQQALDIVTSGRELDVVVTDLNMPGMDGLELLDRLEALDLPLKTIVLTAYGDMQNIRAAMMRGAFDFQVKPLDLDDLRATVAKAHAVVAKLRAGEAARREADALEQRNRHLRDLFGRYVNDEVVEQLLRTPDWPKLAGERRTLTALMADIRGFTRLTEEHPPEVVVRVLDSYLDVACEHILRRGGTINEILGDGLLVFFGAPIADPRAAEHAVAAAIELQLAMSELNRRHRADGLPELTIGIAIHTGSAVVGTVGSDRRLKYTAVGPTLNLLGRIESQARGGQVLISEATYREVRDIVAVSGRFTVNLRDVADPVVLRGVRGIAGDHHRYLPSKATSMIDVPRAQPLTIRRVIDDRLGDPSPGRLLAAGVDAARVSTPLMLAPLDDAAIQLDGQAVFGQVTECEVDDDGWCELTLVYASISDAARREITRATEPRDD